MHLGDKNIVPQVEAFKLVTILTDRNRFLHLRDSNDGSPFLGTYVHMYIAFNHV